MRADRARDRLSAVFLDRDGVINRKAPEGEYVTSWSDFAFLPGALEGLRLLAALELPVVVVTNQRGIERGHMTAADLEAIHGKMRSAVAAAGGRIDAVYHCPHEGGCACRKPGVLLFERAGRDLDFEPANAAVLGDRASDMEAARRLGALAIAVAGTDTDDADYSAVDLVDAVGWLKEPL